MRPLKKLWYRTHEPGYMPPGTPYRGIPEIGDDLRNPASVRYEPEELWIEAALEGYAVLSAAGPAPPVYA